MNGQTVPDTTKRAGMLKELVRNTTLAWRLLFDPRVSLLAKLVPAAALVYVVSPLDLIPDVIPVLGQLDDLAIILIGIRAFIALCPPELVQRHRDDLGQPQPVAPDDDGRTVDGTYEVMDE